MTAQPVNGGVVLGASDRHETVIFVPVLRVGLSRRAAECRSHGSNPF
jgi:hypothetical protein